MSMVTDELRVLETNKFHGKVAEYMAMEDYMSNGYTTIKTGMGSDFLAMTVDDNGKIREEYVEVKFGMAARQSRRQKAMERRLKRNGKLYSVYRVSRELADDYIRNIGLCRQDGLPEHEPNNKMITMPVVCPHCGKTANMFSQLRDSFGFRNMGGKTIRVQSWCKRCRARGAGR